MRQLLDGVSGLASARWAFRRQSWMDSWSEISSQVMSRKRLLLSLDFDGILSQITTRPDEAVLAAGFRSILRQFLTSSRVSLALLSGRSLRDLKRRVDLPNSIYAGNHGMEIEGPGLVSSDGLASSCRSDLVDALAVLTRLTSRLRGVLVEDKGLSITAHWRLASIDDRKLLRELLDLIVRNHPRLQVTEGEASWDLRGRASWKKSNAINQMLEHLSLTHGDLVYIGDRHTDDDTFSQFGDGLTFRLGEPSVSPARYALSSRVEVMRLLSLLLGLVHSTEPEGSAGY